MKCIGGLMWFKFNVYVFCQYLRMYYFCALKMLKE